MLFGYQGAADVTTPSAEFGSNLSRLLQSHGAPLLGPEHRQVGQALDAETARKPTLHRGFQMARLEQLKARRARSRKRFDFWTAVATQMQQVRLDSEPTQNSKRARGAPRSTLSE